jgi:hypothetical protein
MNYGCPNSSVKHLLNWANFSTVLTVIITYSLLPFLEIRDTFFFKGSIIAIVYFITYKALIEPKNKMSYSIEAYPRVHTE